MTKRFTSAALFYVIVGFLTYGMVYNSIMQRDCGVRPESHDPQWNTWWDCDYAKRPFSPPIAYFAGVAWPIYWGKELAIWITR